MPTLSVDTVPANGVTFVEVVVEASAPHRVRIESRLDGPLWPPRRAGSPEPGWDEEGVTTVVEAGRTALGFAVPGTPDGPPVDLVSSEPVSERPDGVTEWLGSVERRLERAESIAEAEGLEEATEAIAAVGDLADVETLVAGIARDRRVMSRLSISSNTLERRLEALDVPTKAYARLEAGVSGET